MAKSKKRKAKENWRDAAEKSHEQLRNIYSELRKAEEKDRRLRKMYVTVARNTLKRLLNKTVYEKFSLNRDKRRAIKKYVEDNLRPDNNGKFDVVSGIDAAIMKLYRKEFLQANRNKSK